MSNETQQLLIDSLKDIKQELREIKADNAAEHKRITDRMNDINSKVVHLESQWKFTTFIVGGSAFIIGLVIKEVVPHLIALFIGG